MSSGTGAHVYVITGTSTGLGAALAEQVLAPGVRLRAIAPQRNPHLDRQAAGCGTQVDQLLMDLSDAPAAAKKMQAWLQPQTDAASVTLINNAAAFERPGPIDTVDIAHTSAALRV